MFDCFKKIIKEKGFFTLFNGVRARILANAI